MNGVWLPYTQMKSAGPPCEVVKTEASTIILKDGRRLVDGIASWWTACHGYNHPHIRAAVQQQLHAMPHIMFGGLVHDGAIALAQRLSKLLPDPLHWSFFSDSGSVAVEVALKMALQYWQNLGRPERRRFVAFKEGYHGDTMATMSICDPEEGMHATFCGIFPEQLIVDLPTDAEKDAAFESVLAQHHSSIAAIIVEPLIQGAGGMRFHTPDVLMRIQNLAQQYGLILIADEVFTGFGRTGTLFAIEQAGIVPDIVTISKALTGGTMGLAATVAQEHIYQAFYDDNPTKALMHGPTFMANPLACAAALASLDLFETGAWKQNVDTIAQQIRAELHTCRSIPGVRDVRVMGAVGVVELTKIHDMGRLKAALLQEGVWIRPLRNVIYLTPAFTIRTEELTLLTRAIEKVLRNQMFV